MTIKMEERKEDRCAHSRIGQCLASPVGRAARVVGGVLFIAGGLLVVRGRPGLIIAAMGVPPLLSGVLDRCGLGALSRGSCAQDH